ncbi:MAG: hypothetical protein IPL39_03125 [Opitutaceae bacterium]|nr:hypothetical protein [Opitutaceae bacterium]
MSDIKSTWLIHTKGALFIVLGTLSAGLIFVQVPTFKTAALLGVTVWAFCRFYYYLFYVLERYLGRQARFAGIIDALGFLLRHRGRAEPGGLGPVDAGSRPGLCDRPDAPKIRSKPPPCP